MYYMSINKNLVHQVGDQTKDILEVKNALVQSVCIRSRSTASAILFKKFNNILHFPHLLQYYNYNTVIVVSQCMV
jgi:hypothetical protein